MGREDANLQAAFTLVGIDCLGLSTQQITVWQARGALVWKKMQTPRKNFPRYSKRDLFASKTVCLLIVVSAVCSHVQGIHSPKRKCFWNSTAPSGGLKGNAVILLCRQSNETACSEEFISVITSVKFISVVAMGYTIIITNRTVKDWETYRNTELYTISVHFPSSSIPLWQIGTCDKMWWYEKKW